MALRVILLLFGVYACSTSAVWIRLSHVPPALLAAYRLLIAAVVLSPIFARDLARARGTFHWKELRRTILPGAVLGLHFIAWIIGARMTPMANATLIVNMVPIAMPFFLLVLIHEKLTGWELGGTAVSMAGVAVLGAADYYISAEHFIGDAVCFVAMLLFCFYLALGRKNRGFTTIWLYVVPLYFVGGVLCLAVAPFLPGEPVAYDAMEIAMILGLALVPTVMGHSILNHCLKHMRGQVVSIINLFQFLFAGIMGLAVFGEAPGRAFYPACALVIAGAIIVLRSGRHGTDKGTIATGESDGS